MVRYLSCFILSLVSLPALAGDLQDLQGTWETTITVQGKPYTIQKTIKDNTETLDLLLGDQLVKRHEVSFELKAAEGFKIFSYAEGNVIKGQGIGTPIPAGKYIYKLKDNTWTAIFGIHPDDPSAPYLLNFKRTTIHNPLPRPKDVPPNET